MVFAAHGGLVVENRALGARITFPERQPEGPAYLAWLSQALRERGCTPVGVDLSELLEAGGSAKYCTLELRA